MKYRNYCVVIMGNTKGVLLEIEKISETKPNILDATGILIATFTSGFEPKEMSQLFKDAKRSFLIFDLNNETSGFHITKPEIHEGLFGFIRNLSDETLKDRADKFLKEVEMSSDTKSNRIFEKQNTVIIKEPKLTKEDISKMSNKEKEELQNKIIDNGVENMSDNDKEILGILWK